MRTVAADLRPGGTVSGPAIFPGDLRARRLRLLHGGREALTVTTNCAIDFMGKPAPGLLTAEARVPNLGRTLSVGDVLAYAEGVEGPVTRAGLTYDIPPR